MTTPRKDDPMTDSDTPELGTDTWAIVEMMGRRRIAGRVTAVQPLEVTDRIQVDIYVNDAPAPAMTQRVHYPVYCLTETTEAVCRKLGARLLASAAPATRWELEASPPAPRDDDVWVTAEAVTDRDPF
jgi:hypothetical protein